MRCRTESLFLEGCSRSHSHRDTLGQKTELTPTSLVPGALNKCYRGNFMLCKIKTCSQWQICNMRVLCYRKWKIILKNSKEIVKRLGKGLNITPYLKLYLTGWDAPGFAIDEIRIPVEIGQLDVVFLRYHGETEKMAVDTLARYCLQMYFGMFKYSQMKAKYGDNCLHPCYKHTMQLCAAAVFQGNHRQIEAAELSILEKN